MSRNYSKHIVRGLPFLRIFITLVFIGILFFPVFLFAQPRDDASQFSAAIESYIVKDLSSSKVLMAKDVDRRVSPASLTKILTCLMAIESRKLEHDVVITQEATMVEPSKAGFKVGDKIKLVDLVKAAMINSSNDAAFAIAIYLSGNVDSFVAAMNSRARSLGMKNSKFTNPAGFDTGLYAGNTSTAGDLLCLTEHAIRNPVFNEVARMERAVFTEQSLHKVYSLKTHNKLLDKYPYAVGIKTGYTVRAGRCLIGRAVKDNRDILMVMLNAKTDRWNVAAEMFDRALQLNRAESLMIARHSVPVVRTRGRLALANIEHKTSKRTHLTLKPGRKSGKNAHVLIASAKKSKSHTVAVTAAGKKLRKSVIHAIAKSERKTEKRTLVLSRSGKKLDKKSLAMVKSNKKMKRHDIALLKSARKNKKKAELS